MTIYLAGPMRGYKDFNYPEFHRVAGILRAMGYVVICPAESFGGETHHGMATYARFDIHALLQVEGIVVLAGWEASDGSKRELAIADWLALPIFRLGTRAGGGAFVYELQPLGATFSIRAWEKP